MIPTDVKKEIVEYYLSRPTTIDDVAKKYNYSTPTILKILNSFGVKRYTKAQLYSPHFREDYFSSIDTEKKAYFLGLLLTDGCIHSSKGRSPMVCLSLKDEDKYIIEELKSELRSNKTITSDGRGCSGVQFLSTQLVRDLKKHGLTSNKSMHETLPTGVSPDLMRHVLRGVFDGDGNYDFTSRPGRKVHRKAIRLCGGRPLLTDVMEHIHSNVHIESTRLLKEHCNDELYSIAYYKNDSIASLIEYMYSDATIYLKRKKKICDLIYSEILRYRDGNTVVTKV